MGVGVGGSGQIFRAVACNRCIQRHAKGMDYEILTIGLLGTYTCRVCGRSGLKQGCGLDEIVAVRDSMIDWMRAKEKS